MPRLRSIAWLIVLGLLGALACSRGPDETQLVRDLEARLDDGFEENLFSVQHFQRRGSAPFTGIGDGTSGVFVYFDTELAFERDYNLTSWSGLNLGTLAFVVGATERGIHGNAPDGNRAGDVLRVSGRLDYQQDEDGAWRVIDRVEPPAPEEPRARRAEGGGPAAVLRNARALAEAPAAPGSPRDAAIVEELGRAIERIDLRFARLDGKMPFGSGSPPGTYHDFGAAFTGYARTQGLLMHNHASSGSVENGARLDRQQLAFALVQSDVAETLYRGWVAEHQLPLPALRAVASLWPEAVHVVTLEGSGIEILSDLQGRRVALGEAGSGSRFSAFRVGAAAGLAAGSIAEVREMKLRDGVAALEAGEVDALFVTEAVPAPALQELARRRRDVRFVELGARTVDTLTAEHFAYYPLTIPARSYPGQTRPVRTLGLAALLMTHRETPGRDVTRVLELLIDGSEELAREYYRAGFISSSTMRLGIAVPLHPAAEGFYALQAEAQEEGAP